MATTEEIIKDGIVYTIDSETRKSVKNPIWNETGLPVKYTKYGEVIFYEAGNFCASKVGLGNGFDIWDVRQPNENAIIQFKGENAKENFLTFWYYCVNKLS